MNDDTEPELETFPLVDVDGLPLYVEDECPTCGAWVANPALHQAWHETILSEARRYRDPPRYGGR